MRLMDRLGNLFQPECQKQAQGNDGNMNEKVAPPSVDLKRPNGGRGVGGFDVVPPVTEETPRTPRVELT